MNNQLIIYRLPRPYGDEEVVCISQKGNSIQISSSDQDLVDFYSKIIPASALAKELKSGQNVLKSIVSSTYGGSVVSVEDGQVSQERFDTELKKLKVSNTIKI